MHDPREILRATALALVVLLAPAMPSAPAMTSASVMPSAPVGGAQEDDLQRRYDAAVFLESVEGDDEAAAAAWLELIAAAPARSEMAYRAHSRLAATLRRLGRVEEARLETERIAALWPERAVATSRQAAGGQSADPGGDDVDRGIAAQVRGLIERLEDPEEREQARKDLAWFGDAVVPYVADAIRGGSLYQSVGAAHVLAKLGTAKADAEIEEALRSEDPLVRRNTLRGLREARRDYPAIVRRIALEDPNPTLRAGAIEMLARSPKGGTWVVEHADEILDDDERESRRALFDAFLYTASARELDASGSDVGEAIRRGLADDWSDTRRAAALALQRVDVAEPARLLVMAMRDADRDVRVTAVRTGLDLYAMNAVSIAEIADPMADLLGDSDSEVRERARQILESAVVTATADEAAAIDRLLAALVDHLADAGADETGQVLLQFRRTSHPELRDLAVDALDIPLARHNALEWIEKSWREDWELPFDRVADLLRPQHRIVETMSTMSAGPGTRATQRVDVGEQVEDVLQKFVRADRIGMLFDLRDELAAVGTAQADTSVWNIDDVLEVAFYRHVDAVDPEDWSRAIRSLPASHGRFNLGELGKTLGRAKPRSALVPVYVEYSRATGTNVAFESLGKLAAAGDEAALDAVVALATDESIGDDARRWVLIEALGEGAADERLMRVAAKRLEESDDDILKLARVLVASEPGSAIVRRAALEGPDDVRIELLASFATVEGKGGPNTVELSDEQLVGALDDPNAEVRREAIQELAKWRAPAGAMLSVFVEAATDSDPYVRRIAVGALAKATEFDAVPVLIEALRDPSDSVRDAARKSLETIRFYAEQRRFWDGWQTIGGDGRDPVARILERVGSDDPAVRIRAIESLGTLGSAAALPSLLDLLESEDAKVREAAARAIDRINAASASPGRFGERDAEADGSEGSDGSRGADDGRGR